MDERIGIIEGKGTGSRLSEIFQNVVSSVCDDAGKQVDFLSFKDRFGYRPHSFRSLEHSFPGGSYQEIRQQVDQEVDDLREFYTEAQDRTRGIFRTAINAETLYYLRRQINKVKIVPLTVDTEHGTKQILFIRDQLQGYYANEEITLGKSGIQGEFGFTDSNFQLLAALTENATERFGFEDADTSFIYKFHLFGLELKKMIEDAVGETGIPEERFDIVQPDTGMHRLLSELPQSDTDKHVVVVGNEVGDMVLESLIHVYDIATKETFYTLNVAMFDDTDSPDLDRGLEVLQTMHGSADDIKGEDRLNPFATIRSAAYALENWIGIPDAVERMESAISRTVEDGVVTPDMGGNSNTGDVVDRVLQRWDSA